LLQNAIASVKANGGHDVPIIIIDDGDRFPVNASLLPAETTILKTNGKVGAGSARNLGVQAANTEYVLFLDDDDEFTNGYVLYVLKECIPSTHKVGVANTSVDVKQKSSVLSKNTSLRKAMFGAGTGLWVERQLFLDISGFGEEHSLDEDSQFFCKLREEGVNIFVSNIVGVKFAPERINHPQHDSLTRNASRKTIADAYFQTANKFIQSRKLSNRDKFDLVARSARVISKLPQADIRMQYELNSKLWSPTHRLLVALRYRIRRFNGELKG
jgi:glycosyltransferase involved in cell wall biosynthesis